MGKNIFISKSCQRQDNNDCQRKDEGINEIEIYTMEGKLVMIENVKFVNNEISFSIHHLERGMYYAKVYLSDGSVVSKKFMKQ
ncbi:MAG: T9SS type A sorting domain-containing protein [Bacteroidetes bacterium]|nr:T9SS type A sorting domain-containing protein [Bacteroidota bacterium]